MSAHEWHVLGSAILGGVWAGIGYSSWRGAEGEDSAAVALFALWLIFSVLALVGVGVYGVTQ